MIVFDNQSYDQTWDVVSAYADRDQRVRIFRNEQNIGPVRNWIRCAEKATGSYTKILFSDDLIEPDFIEKTIEYMRDASVGLVFSTVKIGENRDSAKTTYEWKDKSGIYRSKDFVKSLIFAGSCPYSPGAALFRTEDVKKNIIIDISSPREYEFAKYGAGPDVLLYLLTAASYENIAFCNESLAFFRSHKGSITVENKDNQVVEGYMLALIWFAETMMDDRSWLRLIARNWVRECWLHRRWISITKVSTKYSKKNIYIFCFLLSAVVEIIRFMCCRMLKKRLISFEN